MLNKSWILAITASFSLAGCLESDGERALVGAGVGCIASEAITGGDCTTGALGGALIGTLADDVTGR
jgi:hypothetical protein